MSDKSPSILGVGINDANYQLTKYEYVDGKKVMTWRCPYYITWKEMLARCYNKRVHKSHVSYAECSVCSEWLVFSKFKNWMQRQDWNGKALDKDLLVEGNKVYSPESCIFVSRELNNFITGSPSAGRALPVGVIWDRQKKKYRSDCGDPIAKKRKHLGYFDSPQEAHEAWRKKKHEWACFYAEQVNDPRLAKALRERFAEPEK